MIENINSNLLSIINEGESTTVEFKEAKGRLPSKSCKTNNNKGCDIYRKCK